MFATPDTTVYAICPGRGFDDAVTILGADFDGVLVRDGWAPYRRFDDALHQTCVAHLLRRCQYLRDDHPDSTWAGQVEAVLQAGLALRNRRDDGALTDHGLASVRGRLFSVNYFGLLATIILAGSGATWTGVESMVMA